MGAARVCVCVCVFQFKMFSLCICSRSGHLLWKLADSESSRSSTTANEYCKKKMLKKEKKKKKKVRMQNCQITGIKKKGVFDGDPGLERVRGE